MTLGVENSREQENASSEEASVKRNLNDAFKTQMVPDKINIIDLPRQP